MDIKIIPTNELGENYNEPYIALIIKSEKECGEGNLDIELCKKGIRELGFKFLHEQAIKLHNAYSYAIFDKNKLIGKYSIILKKVENKTVSFLDYIYIIKEYRNKNVASNLIKSIVHEHDFFGIENPLRNSLNFWNKIIAKMYSENIITSCYFIFPSGENTNGYLCVGGDSIVINDLGRYPNVILKHRFTPRELDKVINKNLISVPQKIKDIFMRNFLK